MYQVFSLNRACCSGRLLSLIKMSLMSCRVFPGIPARSSRMGFGSLPGPRPAPLQQPSAALRLLPGRQQRGGCCCFPWEELLLQVVQSASQDFEKSLGMWMSNFAYINREQFSESVHQLSAENQDSLEFIKSCVQKLKLPQSIIALAYLGWVSSKDRTTTISAQV